MNKETILILGAKSDIGIALAHEFAKNKNKIILAGRNIVKLENERKAIMSLYSVEVVLHEFNVLNLSDHLKLINELKNLPSIVISTIGLLGNQDEDELNSEKAIKVIKSNYEGPALIFLKFAKKFEQRGYGTLVGFSSVAGERGRANNYIYGSAKSGFTTFLSGLRNKYSSKGVHVITVLPGYVFTKMTKNMNLPKFLTAQPKEVAQDVVKALSNNKNIIFTPSIWRLIIFILKLIPESLFKKTNI